MVMIYMCNYPMCKSHGICVMQINHFCTNVGQLNSLILPLTVCFQHAHKFQFIYLRLTSHHPLVISLENKSKYRKPPDISVQNTLLSPAQIPGIQTPVLHRWRQCHVLGQPRNAYWGHWQSQASRLSQPVGCKAAAEPKETPWSDSWISFSFHVFVCQAQADAGVSPSTCTRSLCAVTQQQSGGCWCIFGYLHILNH